MEEEKRKSWEWMEYLSKACDSFFKEMKGFIPEDTYEHFKNSRKEFLLALRSLLDRKIEKLEKKEIHRIDVK
jgi:hypothetical protein